MLHQNFDSINFQRFIREIRLSADEVAKFSVGQVIGPKDVFADNIPVDVEGWSKGKGYQGVIKKHHMSGMTRAHGTHEYFRHGGSIGCRLTPQRVHKGKRMAGQMGNETVTVQNLQEGSKTVVLFPSPTRNMDQGLEEQDISQRVLEKP